MIITKLIGGLGNQMFQYAVGRRAAYINKTLFKLDVSGFKKQEDMTKREYFLGCFNISESFANEKEVKKLKTVGKSKLSRYFLKFISFFTLYNKRSHIAEKHFYFDPNILKVREDTYLEGYWASERYFKDIENIIRHDFTFKVKPDSENKKLIKKIENSMSVSIHVRRGDYVSVRKTQECHGVCNLDYYKKAIKLITAKVKKPHFFIFSDDPEWVKQNLKLSYPNTVVDHNFQKKDYEDLRLMSLCKHNIIANSSFSWWGAWLNQNKNKVIIAPRRWFNNVLINTKDLVPQFWIKI